MERSCENCIRHGEPITGYKCYTCVTSGNRSNWEPRETLHERTKQFLNLVNTDPKFDYKPIGEEFMASIKDVREYYKNVAAFTKELCDSHVRGRFNMMTKPEIKKVIFNDPATIVIWKDGTKTVVKAQDGDIFDPEKGLAMAISKKVLGNKGNYFKEFKKWPPKVETNDSVTELRSSVETLKEAFKKR